MLPKHSRLTAREVRAILKGGRSVRGGGVSAKFTPASKGKAAIVVSAKVAKKATERNALRRAAYRALPSLPKAHIVFFIQTKTFDPDELANLCSRLSS